MTTGFKAKAARRDSELVVPDIEGFLTGEDAYQALNRALRALTSEAKKLRSRRAAAGALADAQLAGWIAGTAAGVHLYNPRRPAGKRAGMPAAEQLLEVFRGAYLQATGEPDD